MRSLNDTIGRLAARQAALAAMVPSGPGALADLGAFGSNPGALAGRIFVPATLPAGAPLVVVLHGCTQSAADYDRGAGWSALAAEQGFALLYAEQTRGNNANLCFNWFVPGDFRRGGGEALSIHQMIEAMVAAHRLDARRVFINGLSAGGAMAMAMLAVYPEVFAGGAVIAGVPYGAATTVPEAFDRMRGQGLPSPASLASYIRRASPHTGAWPRLSVWQGSEDTTVDPANADAIARSWALLQGLDTSAHDTVNGQARQIWHDGRGRQAIEAITIAGMGHGTPIATTGAEACGTPGPYMLDAGISSTRRIAAFWDIAPAVADGPAPMVRAGGAASFGRPESGVEAMINGALRQAGLIR